MMLVSCGRGYYSGYEMSSSRYGGYTEPAPPGMVLIPQGSIRLGSTGQDSLWGLPSDTEWMSVDGFWMDETEVTNAKYRQFVHWVRDSIIRERLYDPLYGGNELFKITEDRYGEPVTPRLDWSRSIPWFRSLEEESMAIESVYTVNPVTGEKRLDAKQMNFRYEWYDHATAIRSPAVIQKDTAYVDANGKIVSRRITRPSSGAADFLNTYIVNIYPDQSCWLTDFEQEGMERYARTYFDYTQYDNHPVVGVSWEMATAYCAWRTLLYQRQVPEGIVTEAFRLPTEAEWEYAARAGKSTYCYPWGVTVSVDGKGCLPGNFKPAEGDYTADGHLITARVRSYPPNDFGLYDMAGNVAEWTSSAYTTDGYVQSGKLNPDAGQKPIGEDLPQWEKKVVKGGSWKDLPPFVRSDWRTAEYRQQFHSYLGFRCVKSYTGNPKRRK